MKFKLKLRHLICMLVLGFYINCLPVLSNLNNHFSIITYNIAGLWQPISGSHPRTNTTLISKKVNKYDICLFQEDFNYHKKLMKYDNHKYRSPHKDINGWGTGIGDGLSRFSNFAFQNFKRTKWSHCSGIIGDEEDCDTPKGFTFARHILKDHIIVDIYNIHNDAGDSSKDEDVRYKNISQLLEHVNLWSTGHAVIIGGDTNKRSISEGGIQQLINAGFTDTWTKFNKDGEPETSHNIDKILYRSSKAVKLQPIQIKRLATEFIDSHRKQLSDHIPYYVLFNYSHGDKYKLSESLGVEYDGKYFNDILEFSQKNMLRSVQLRGDNNAIYGLNSLYTNNKRLLRGENIGNTKELKLKPNEILVKAELCSVNNKKITKIAFISLTTNLNNSIKMGSKTRECKTFRADKNWQIAGFYGNNNKNNIYNLGVVFSKL